MSKSRVAERSAAYALKTAVEPAFGTSFDLLAMAPQGVAKLRELILSLAVRGKLVPQDAAESPASPPPGFQVKPSTDIGLLEMPSGWQMCSLSQFSPDFQNGLASRGDVGGLPTIVLRLADIEHGRISLAETRSIPVQASSIDKYRLLANDLLIIRVNGSSELVGRFIRCENEIDAIYCDHFIRMRISPGLIDPRYLLLVGDSTLVRNRIAGLFITTAGQKTVNQGHIGSLPIPLPPLAEQARIVARVEELMQLCDALEAHGRLQDEQHARLVATLFDALAASASAEELAENWQRITTHFDLLLDRPEAVDALEQTLLQLAVRGLLVPQDPTDEPASELLASIRKEKDRLISEGRIKRDKPLPPVGDDEKPFEVPSGWAWGRMNHLSDNRLGKMLDKTKNTGKLYPYLRNTNVQWHRIELDDVKQIRLEDHEVDEYKLAVGDLLVCEGGYPGRCAIWDHQAEEMFFQKALHRVRPLGGVMAKYLEICLRTDSDLGVLKKYFTGATIKHFAGQELNRYVIPVPPLGEQHRIVDRVEQLRRLCADLRERLQQARANQSRLADALVSAAAQSPSC